MLVFFLSAFHLATHPESRIPLSDKTKNADIFASISEKTWLSKKLDALYEIL